MVIVGSVKFRGISLHHFLQQISIFSFVGEIVSTILRKLSPDTINKIRVPCGVCSGMIQPCKWTVHWSIYTQCCIRKCFLGDARWGGHGDPHTSMLSRVSFQVPQNIEMAEKTGWEDMG